ncbi:hypothetical protein ACIPYV_02860 [Paenarthrobacter nicotinovorans]|uniref:hypothetical protein n=1 Tax=Paenarthrobacter nicotinovorans TaxID=29320 RepID=UPI00380267B7
MIDLKTSRYVYGETGLQTAAYSLAEYHLDEDGKEQPSRKSCPVRRPRNPYGQTRTERPLRGSAPRHHLVPLVKNRDELKGHSAMFLAAFYTDKTTKLQESTVGDPVTTQKAAAA